MHVATAADSSIVVPQSGPVLRQIKISAARRADRGDENTIETAGENFRNYIFGDQHIPAGIKA